MSSRGLSRAGRGQDAGDRRDLCDEAINPTKSNTRARSDSTRVFGHTAFIPMYQSCISLNARDDDSEKHPKLSQGPYLVRTDASSRFAKF